MSTGERVTLHEMIAQQAAELEPLYEMIRREQAELRAALLDTCAPSADKVNGTLEQGSPDNANSILEKGDKVNHGRIR